MNPNAGWGWKIYFILFSVIVLGNLAGVLSPQTFPYQYYHILIIFHENYIMLYYLTIASAVVNTIGLIPLALYVFRIKFLSPRIWQWFFIIRVITDIMGHSYEAKHIQSFFLTEFWLGLLALVPIVIIMFPSYLADFEYGFRQDKLFAQSSVS